MLSRKRNYLDNKNLLPKSRTLLQVHNNSIKTLQLNQKNVSLENLFLKKITINY